MTGARRLAGQLANLLNRDLAMFPLLDPADQLAARLARDGDPEPSSIEETIPPSRSVEGPLVASKALPSTSITIPVSLSTILGYPTHLLSQGQS